MNTDDTIAAIATANGGAARGIVRLSGPAILAVLRPCLTLNDEWTWETIRTPHVVSGTLHLDDGIGVLPCDVYLWPNLRSYTRQPMAELHTLGSPPLLQATLRTLCKHGARVAGPGEFTLRAFLAGRLDLVQAEAVLGVIEAHGATQFRAALLQLAGGMSQPIHELRNQLLDLLADVEAGLDFVDEDIEFVSVQEVRNRLRVAMEAIDRLRDRLRNSDATQLQPRVVFLGAANAGKSSLWNALLGRDAAIVSDTPGTTRDYLTATVDWQQLRVELVDTAGIQADSDHRPLYEAAQSMAQQSRRLADLELWCVEASQLQLGSALPPWPQATTHSPPRIVVATKMDLVDSNRNPHVGVPGVPMVATSSRTRTGLDRLQALILEFLARDSCQDSTVVSSTAARCGDGLRRCGEALGRAIDILDDGAGDELIAADLHLALDELGQVVGAIYTEDLLDRIFSRFCIGK